MLEFLSGITIMYLLGFTLLINLVEPVDEEADPNAPQRLAILWPIAALEALYFMLRGDN